MSVSIASVMPVIEYSVRELCLLPYKGRPDGCPNHNKKKRCPPNAILFEDHFDMEKPFYAIYNAFDLQSHVDRMRLRHPEWTEKQLRNCYYWQHTARKVLKEEVFKFIKNNKGYSATFCPEGEGINVFKTMNSIGVKMQWPPRTVAYQVAIAGVFKKKHDCISDIDIDFF